MGHRKRQRDSVKRGGLDVGVAGWIMGDAKRI
jgi:hypothetical protein